MSTDPTRYPRPLEPTQGVYYNPYELTSPYGGNIPPPPPPPPKQGHKGLLVALIILSCLVVVLGGALITLSYQHSQKPATAALPTLAPTPTATPTNPSKPTPTPTMMPLFSDSFANDNAGWDLSSTPGKFSVKIGGGSMVLEDDEHRLFMEVVPGNSLVDFRLDVDASLSKGDPTNGYGVFIRGALGPDGNLGTYYRFELYGDGTYAIFKGSPDASGKTLSNQVHGYTASSAILKGSQVNHITIIARGSSMTFMVNGQALYTYVDNNYKSGSVALFVSNLLTLPAGAQATFSQLAIFPAT